MDDWSFEDFCAFVETLPPQTCAQEQELHDKLEELAIHGPHIQYMVRVPEDDQETH